ncbi:MAG: class I SAM-dependent methyltransferase, partial [Gillisia sp.]
TQKFEAIFSENSPAPQYSLPKKYLFEPNPAIMKSGLFNEVALKTATAKLHENSHLYTSDVLRDFPGRCFEIMDILPFNNKLKKKLDLKKANFTTRNFPKSVAQLRKELKIKEGGKDYIFFTTLTDGKKNALLCRKVAD